MITTHVHRVGPFSGISFHSSQMEPKFSKAANYLITLAVGAAFLCKLNRNAIPLTRLKIAPHFHGSIMRVPTCKSKHLESQRLHKNKQAPSLENSHDQSSEERRAT